MGEFDSGNAGWSQNLCAGGNVAIPQQKRKEEEVLCLLTGIRPVRIDGVGPRVELELKTEQLTQRFKSAVFLKVLFFSKRTHGNARGSFLSEWHSS